MFPLQLGGGPSLGAILLVVGAGIFAIGRFTSLNPIGWVRGAVPSGGDGLLPDLGRWRGVLLAGVVLAMALILGGAVDVPAGSGIQLVVMLELVGLYLLLRAFDAYSFRFFALAAAATVLLALSALGEPIIGGIAQSDAFPIIALGLLYLGYEAVQAYRKRSRPKIIYRRGGD